MRLNDIQALVQSPMDSVNKLIAGRLETDILLIDKLSQHIIHSGGKRVRPLVLLLCAAALGYEGNEHISLAAIVEFIHTATLLHDDVVDASDKRRGLESANAIWGNEASVLVGDFLFSRSFQLMAELGSLRIMSILSEASNTIAKGEVLQLMNQHDPNTSEENYYQVIKAKTAKLFSAAAQLSAVVAKASPAVENAMENYGLHLGMAFQIVDDILDYEGDAESLGKNIGDDLSEGKPTLPLIYALQKGNDLQKAAIQRAILQGSLEELPLIREAIAASKAVNYSYDAAQRHVADAKKALEVIPDSQYKQGLIALAEFTLNRNH